MGRGCVGPPWPPGRHTQTCWESGCYPRVRSTGGVVLALRWRSKLALTVLARALPPLGPWLKEACPGAGGGYSGPPRMVLPKGILFWAVSLPGAR